MATTVISLTYKYNTIQPLINMANIRQIHLSTFAIIIIFGFPKTQLPLPMKMSEFFEISLCGFQF